MADKKKDNSTLSSKVRLRRALLQEIDTPVVMETHGGMGEIWKYAYRVIPFGVVLEKDTTKVQHVAFQRPEWAVYQCNNEIALEGGIAGDMGINFVDVDPYGEPWSVLDALFAGDRDWPEILGLVVTDGLRQKCKMNGAWSVASLEEVVSRHGNDAIYDNYLDICQELLIEKSAQAGYAMRRWWGYYCGHAKQTTHYAALLMRS